MHGVDEMLLLGTEPTMNSGAFLDYLERYGIRAFVPPDDHLKSKVTDLIAELFTGKSENGRARIQAIVDPSLEQTGVRKKVVCLACTELPLAFEGNEHLGTFEEDGVLYLNTTIIHANAAFRYAVSG